ncbi:hypothetical protein [Halococcus saccharolyticus]|uniref:Uncharacterized protein n=1 Tax=Halococcus saccharolyticus DSM 5350 TaxID=1227455 RepID=M0MQM1_9EURY|nr:hypothetical protein [Halococcus saccharolyticus]EMA47997.1 hypothetical protein C449_00955 [Halococcus saccharolyticus DSM 5350]
MPSTAIEPHEAFRDLINILNEADHGFTRVEFTGHGSEWQGGKFEATLVGGWQENAERYMNTDLDAAEANLQQTLEDHEFAFFEDGFRFEASDEEDYDGMYEATLTLARFTDD